MIIAGQSNASGRGELNTTNESPDARVLVFGNDYSYHVAAESVDAPTNQVDAVSVDTIAKHGFALRAGKDLAGAGYGIVGLIPCAKGASSLAQWRPGSNPLDRSTLFGSCNYRRQVATSGRPVSAVWWYQGEGENASDSLRQAFAANHTLFVNGLRQQMGLNLPVVYAQLAKNGLDPFNSGFQVIAEQQRRLETGSGAVEALAAHYMVVTFDLPLTGSVHLNQTGQKELGRRVALAMRQRVFGENIDGTGPRLAALHPAIHPLGDRSRVKLAFTKPVNPAVDQYDHQFRVFDDGVEVSITSVDRDPADPTAVMLTLVQPTQGAATVSYGDVLPASSGIWLRNVIKGANALPAPRFGPIAIAVEPAANQLQALQADETEPNLSTALSVEITVTPTATMTETLTATASPTSSPEVTATPSDTPTATPTETATATPTPIPEATPVDASPTSTITPATPFAGTPEGDLTPTPDLTPLQLWLPLIRSSS